MLKQTKDSNLLTKLFIAVIPAAERRWERGSRRTAPQSRPLRNTPWSATTSATSRSRTERSYPGSRSHWPCSKTSSSPRGEITGTNLFTCCFSSALRCLPFARPRWWSQSKLFHVKVVVVRRRRRRRLLCQLPQNEICSYQRTHQIVWLRIKCSSCHWIESSLWIWTQKAWHKKRHIEIGNEAGACLQTAVSKRLLWTLLWSFFTLAVTLCLCCTFPFHHGCN